MHNNSQALLQMHWRALRGILGQLLVKASYLDWSGRQDMKHHVVHLPLRPYLKDGKGLIVIEIYVITSIAYENSRAWAFANHIA